MNNPKTKLIYFDGIKEQQVKEGEDGVLSISAKNGVATIHLEEEQMVTVYSPYMKVLGYYDAP